jgi:hypothetical protein
MIEAPPNPREVEDKYNLNAMSREEVADFIVAKAALFVEHYRGADSCVEWAYEVQRAKVRRRTRRPCVRPPSPPPPLTSHPLRLAACAALPFMR